MRTTLFVNLLQFSSLTKFSPLQPAARLTGFQPLSATRSK